MMIIVVCVEIWKINNLFHSCEIFRQPEHKSSLKCLFFVMETNSELASRARKIKQ